MTSQVSKRKLHFILILVFKEETSRFFLDKDGQVFFNVILTFYFLTMVILVTRPLQTGFKIAVRAGLLPYYNYKL